jgi:serine/threonine-protein kinase
METTIGKEILNYRIEQELGKGGMGSVYLAVNKNIDQKVAIKVLNENLADSVVIRKKFRDEAQLLCSLDHPNIVKFLNFVEDEDGVFLIMDLIDGITLEEFINAKNGLIVEKRAYEMFDQILNAFSYAHKKGVIHRDIKPANIILTNDSEGNFVPKVLDFGIATIVSESTETEKGWVVGTPSYMSPEQVLGINIDTRSDIYSLGVLLHQMLTGRAPYDTTTLSELEINNKVVKDPLPRMKEFYPYISVKMQKMVDKATAKEPGKRYQNCNDFRKILKNTLNPEPIKRVIKIATAALVLLLLGGGLWYWDYNRVKTYYYKDYVEQWGVPQGIHKLSASQFRGRKTSYRFEYKQKKLQSLALVNSNGNVAEDIDAERFTGRPVSEPEWFDRTINATFSYRANGNIDYALYLNRSGKVSFKKSYDEGRDGKINMFIFRYNDEFGTEKQLPKDMTGYVRLDDEDAERGNVSRFALVFDGRGFVSAMHYRNMNQPVGDGEHVYGKRYERDGKGRVIREYFLSHDDSTRATSWGLGIKQFEYDAEDNWVKAVYLAPDGSPSYNAPDGFSVLAMEYDQKYGNRIYSWYQTLDGSLTIPEKYGAAGKKYEYNEAGQNIESFFLGTDKNPMYSTVTGCIGEQYEYDDNGYLSKFSYIDENRHLAVGIEGSSVVLYKNDNKGNNLERQFFNIDNQPFEIPAGYSKFIFEYDNLGNPVSCRYYDTKDALCLSIEGMAGWSREYNDQNQLIKESYFGTDNQPNEKNNGVVIVIEDRDVRGNVIKHAYYQADEKTLKLSTDGIAGWKSEYDNGKETKREFFDEKEQPTAGNFDYAKWEAVYDDMGNRTEISYLNKNGDFIYGYKDTYDARGNELESFRFGQDKKLAKGWLIGRRKYDDRDNCIEQALYDENNKLALNNAGYAKVTYLFDDRNQEVEKRYYNGQGNLFVNPDEGYAIQKIEYDNKGNETKVSYLNAAEKPLKRIKKGSYAYATQIRENDAFRRVIRVVHFDEQGNPTKYGGKLEDGAPPEILYEYDKWGNLNYTAHADGSGNIINNSAAGYAICRSEHDIRRNLLSESYYDRDNKPCTDKDRNVHKVEWAYDKHNRQTEISYYDVNNKPCVNTGSNIHKIESTYNAQGNETEIRFYDASVSLRRDDYAIEKNKYDEQNRMIECARYDYLDRPFNYNRRWHRYVLSYEESGVIYEKYYAVNNNVVQEYKYDPQTDQWTRSDGWRVYFENSMRSLPITLNNYTRVTAITLSSNYCTVTVRINFSKYDLSNEDMRILEDEGRSNAEYWWEDSDMPRNATIVVVGMDNAGRELYRVSY